MPTHWRRLARSASYPYREDRTTGCRALAVAQQEQQRVAVGPGKAHCMSIRQVAQHLRALCCGPPLLLRPLLRAALLLL